MEIEMFLPHDATRALIYSTKILPKASVRSRTKSSVMDTENSKNSFIVSLASFISSTAD